MTRLCLASGLTIRALPDGDAVVARDDGAEAIILNPTAHIVIEMFAKPATSDEIVSLFCETFPDDDTAAIRRDVGELIQRLLATGILETCGNAPSTA